MSKKKRTVIPFVERPFEGLNPEAELVAMREILPLATIEAQLTSGHEVTFATILPGMASAIRREDGVLLVAVQTVMSSGDPSLDIATRVLRGLDLRARNQPRTLRAARTGATPSGYCRELRRIRTARGTHLLDDRRRGG